MFERIVVPLDGSKIAEQALPQVEWLARAAGAPVHLVRVVDVAEFPWFNQFENKLEFAAAENAIGEASSAAAAYLSATAERLAKAGLVPSIEIRRGLTSQELTAATRPGDLIVLASHGRGGVTRWFLGSVAEDVLRHAEVPVLLVRTSAP